MRRLLIAALLIATPVAVLPQSPPAPQPAAAATLEQTIPAIDAYFRRYQREAHVPGLVYGIVQGGRLVLDLDSGRAVMDGGTASSGGRVTGRFTVPRRTGGN